MYNDIGLDYLLEGLDLNFTTPGLSGTTAGETETTTDDNVDSQIESLIKGKTN